MKDKNKISVLITPSDRYGVGFFRSTSPAIEMERNHNSEFYVEINHEPNVQDHEYLKQFDIIHFHRQFGPKELEDETFAFLKSQGIVVICDLDDWHTPFTKHPLALLVKKHDMARKITSTLSKVDWVTTTTDIFKKELEKINQNVFVIPNAIDPREKVWQPIDYKKEGDTRCRIGFMGGSSHGADLELMEHSFELLYNNEELKNKFQLHLAGFDVRGTKTIITPDGKETQSVITADESIWYHTFERYFTSSYKGLSDNPEYVEWLKKIVKEPYYDEYNQRYIRHWTRQLSSYPLHLGHFDCMLAPLDEYDYITTENGQIIKQVNMFNKVKSELKIIEAGMKKKALIAQDFGIYKELLEHNETALLVSKNEKGWYQAMRRMILEPGLKERLAENLHNLVKDKYDIKNVTKDRCDFYKRVLEEARTKNAIKA